MGHKNQNFLITSFVSMTFMLLTTAVVLVPSNIRDFRDFRNFRDFHLHIRRFSKICHAEFLRISSNSHNNPYL
jgi:hypothetical protein